jgi:hypothetical protein
MKAYGKAGTSNGAYTWSPSESMETWRLIMKIRQIALIKATGGVIIEGALAVTLKLQGKLRTMLSKGAISATIETNEGMAQIQSNEYCRLTIETLATRKKIAYARGIRTRECL